MNDPYETARVFFLGAGFSAGARVPLTNSLLPIAARLFREDAAGLFERIGWWASDADVDLNGSPNSDDFARFCTHLDFMELREHGGGERWSAEGSRERLALKFYLAKAIALHTPAPSDIPQLYVDFAGQLTDHDVVVTFNWDVLLELAMLRAKKPYSYIGEPGKTLIMKLHGSIDWIGAPPRAWTREAPAFNYKPLGFEKEPADDIYASETVRTSSTWNRARVLVDEIRPLIVLPGYGKAVDVRLLSGIWYRPEALNLRGGGVSIIGLSVSNDDYIVESLFRYLFRSTYSPGRHIRLLNPDPLANDRFRRLGPEMHIEAIVDVFSGSTIKDVLFQ